MHDVPQGYCRYCSWSAYQGDDYAVCTAEKNMGMTVTKRSKHKSCKDFDFNTYDVFSPDFGNNLREYKPRKPRAKSIEGQLSLFGGLNE